MKLKLILMTLLLVAVVVVRAQSKILKTGDKCPDLVFIDRDYNLVSLEEFRGQYVYINVWAESESRCMAEIPYLKKLRETFKGKDVVFLSICNDKRADAHELWTNVITQNKLEEPQWMISAADGFIDLLKVTSIPRYILLGPDMTIIDDNMTGPSDKATEKRLHEILVRPMVKVSEINFLDLSLKEALDKAAAENKLVFLDAYTDWCGPCKLMNQTVLREEKVCDYVNKNFVSIKMNAEKGEGPEAVRKYMISAYPTYMLIEPDGSLRHKFTGGTKTGEEFVGKLSEGMLDDVAVGLLESKYKAGNCSKDLVLKYINALMNVGNFIKANEVASTWFGSLPDNEKTGKDYWFIYESPALTFDGSDNFKYILDHKKQFYKNVGNESVDKKIIDVFGKSLENIYIGRKKNATINDVKLIRQAIIDSDLPDEKYKFLEAYVTLANVSLEKDYEKIITLLENLAPVWSDAEVNQRFFSLGMAVATKGTKDQRQRLITLCDKLLERDDLSRAVNALKSFLPYIKSM